MYPLFIILVYDYNLLLDLEKQRKLFDNKIYIDRKS